MIDYFDNAIEDNLSIEMFESVGEKIEFKHSKELFVLRNLSIEAYNSKYENDEKWRKEIAEELKII